MGMTEDEIWDDVVKSMKKYDDECRRINERIFNAIKNQIGEGFVNQLITLLNEYQCSGAFSIVSEDSVMGKYQQEEDFGYITGIWVDQWAVGDSGDSWSGDIWVKLKNNKYLQASYSM